METSTIPYFHRKHQRLEEETIYGRQALQWLYQTPWGLRLGPILSHPWVSRLYGLYQNSSLSRKKIPPFVKTFSIDLSEFEHNEEDYPSFNQFFIRKFRPGKRPFAQEPSQMPAFAEGRYLGVTSLPPQGHIVVKGAHVSPQGLLGKEEAQRFQEGPLLVARLCPVDYHRFHFFDDGDIIKTYQKKGPLHSVNPWALKQRPQTLLTNERSITLMETQNFGNVAYVEVGAICVGKIVSTHKNQTFQRGEEKGYFLFGGSTVLIIGEKGRWRPSEDILKYSQEGIETFIHLGDQVASKLI